MQSGFRVEEQAGQDVAGFAVGYHHADAAGCHLAGGVVFRLHAAAPCGALLGLYVLVEIVLRLHLADELAGWVVRVASVYAVDVAEQDEGLGVHHLGYETRELVVVGEHKTCETDGVVLVDYGYDAIVEHELYARLLVAILVASLEVCLHGEHLTDVETVLAEEVVVEVDELHLTHSREQLTLSYGVEVLLNPEFLTTACHGS